MAPTKKNENIPASLAAATDEHNAVVALSAAGWPGRSAQATLAAAQAVVKATGRMAQNAADIELAKAAAKAAGATGIAQHDRSRVSTLIGDGKSVPEAAAEAAPSRDGAARALVWYVAALQAAESQLA